MLTLKHDDCLKTLEGLESNSIDSIVTDPPYGISILDEKWDKTLPMDKVWRECYRVLKPGGYIMAFSSARTYHNLATQMENEGFETHNMLAWVYATGFPKGACLARQFDRSVKLTKPDDKFRQYLKDAIKKKGYTRAKVEELCNTKMFGHYLGRSQPQYPSYENWQIIKRVLDLDATYDEFFKKRKEEKESLVSSRGKDKGGRYYQSISKNFKKYEPDTPNAKEWVGWKYGKMTLKPAIEPIYFGQKPYEKPITDNILKFRVGALNVKDCKITGKDGVKRMPSNVLHDGSYEVVKLMDKEKSKASITLNEFPHEKVPPFFSVPKPSTSERGENNHPTVKPVRLMKHLVKLITPKGGTCLDPFMGSGTTGVACIDEDVDFLGIEKEKAYFDIAQNRLVSKSQQRKKKALLS